MKHIIIFIILLAITLTTEAKKYSYSFHNTPVSKALVKICQDNPDINITFVYKKLNNYKTSSIIDTDDVSDAIKAIVGIHPISVSESKGIFYIEALQNGRYIYKGHLTDSHNNPVEAATILLLSPKDSTVITYGISTSDGEFCIPCDKNKIIAKVVCLGYNTLYHNPSKFNIGNLKLSEKPILLRGVSVEADMTALSPDKNSYIPSQRQKKFSQTGVDLLRHMAIPTLVVAPGSETVTDVFGNTCEAFINYMPASKDELTGINVADIRRIEVLDSPDDPRFRGVRKAINFIVQQYEYGGYTKAKVSETALNGFRNKIDLFSKFAYKKMTFDFFAGVDNNVNHHSG